MEIITVKYLITDEIQKGLQGGKLSRYGSVIRSNNTNQYFKHLQEIVDIDKEKSIKSSKGMAIATAVIVGVGISSAVAYKGYKHLQEKGYLKNKYDKSVDELMNIFSIYVEAIKEGKLTIEIIENLMKSLNETISIHKQNNKKIKIGIDEFQSMFAIISDYTLKFAEANNVECPVIEEKSDDILNNKIMDINKYLKIQKEILKRAG